MVVVVVVVASLKIEIIMIIIIMLLIQRFSQYYADTFCHIEIRKNTARKREKEMERKREGDGSVKKDHHYNDDSGD